MQPTNLPLATTPSTNRQAYLDWLRILAILGVLFFHSAMAFVADWGWHIKNKQTSNLLLEFNFWLHNFRMPLLFFISGTVSYFMLQRRSGGGFIGLRFRRLFIPLLFGMLVIVPPQVYMERLTQGYTGNFWSWYPSIFHTGAYPKGNLSWHHLWFILYLLLYDIVCAPAFVWLMSERGRRWLSRLNGLALGQRIYLLILPGLLVRTFMTMRWPETNDLIHDPAYLLYWLLFLLTGFLCIANSLLMDSLERNRRTSLAMAFLALLAINYLRWNHLEPGYVLVHWQTDPRTYLYLALNALNAWAWVMAAIGYGKRYLNRRHRVLDYLNQAVYPFYILHQTVIVVLVYYVVQTTDGIGMKYLFVLGVTFAVTVGIYHLFIRPFGMMRLLFGMKPRGERAMAPAADRESVGGRPLTGDGQASEGQTAETAPLAIQIP
ncbi:MAG: acyltransferase family protein [Bacteroidota bacterium]|nr:acyltransferase family protein [Bacteroidota bacterium]